MNEKKSLKWSEREKKTQTVDNLSFRANKLS